MMKWECEISTLKDNKGLLYGLIVAILKRKNIVNRFKT